MKRDTPALHVVQPQDEPTQPATPASSKRWKDKGWKYTRGDDTNLRKTFERIRREQAAAKKPKGKK
jgi:hypothetical protein